MLREVNKDDFQGLSDLYTHLHGNKPIIQNEKNESIWNTILADENHHIIVAEEDGKIVSSCVCVIVPNLTHNQQPYALIENVVRIKLTGKRDSLRNAFPMHGRSRGSKIVIRSCCLPALKSDPLIDFTVKMVLTVLKKQDISSGCNALILT